MLYDIFNAIWPVLVFLGMAYCAQGFSDPEPDTTFEHIDNQIKNK